MRREISEGRRILCVSLLGVVLALGLSPGVEAFTSCDIINNVYSSFQPTVDPTLLNGLLNALGEIPIDFVVDTHVSLLYGHTLHFTVDSGVNLAGVDFTVTPAVGSLEVDLALPAWNGSLTLTVSHDACRNCDAEFNSCVNNCVSNPSFPCFGVRLCCETGCAPARVVCEADRLACQAEATAVETFLDGHTAGLGFSSAVVTQRADVCVLKNGCEAVHPLESTHAAISGFHLVLFPEGDPLGIGRWLNTVFSGLVNWLVNIEQQIENFFVPSPGVGLLINVFDADIKNDGCLPVQEVTDCKGGGCSTVNQPANTSGKSTNLLFYGLPIGLLFGLIVWARIRRR